MNGESPIIFGDGRRSRDFTPVASVVAANLLAATSTKDLCGQVVNIGTGARTDLLTLAQIMARNAQGCSCGRAAADAGLQAGTPG